MSRDTHSNRRCGCTKLLHMPKDATFLFCFDVFDCFSGINDGAISMPPWFALPGGPLCQTHGETSETFGSAAHSLPPTIQVNSHRSYQLATGQCTHHNPCNMYCQNSSTCTLTLYFQEWFITVMHVCYPFISRGHQDAIISQKSVIQLACAVLETLESPSSRHWDQMASTEKVWFCLILSFFGLVPCTCALCLFLYTHATKMYLWRPIPLYNNILSRFDVWLGNFFPIVFFFYRSFCMELSTVRVRVLYPSWLN